MAEFLLGTLFWLLVIILAFYILPIYLLWRKYRMQTFANEFHLSFNQVGIPRLKDFIFGTWWGVFGPKSGDRIMNQLEGELKGHHIKIYDRMHFFWDANYPRHTVVEIDGKVINGPAGYVWYELFFSRRFTSIARLRKYLRDLK